MDSGALSESDLDRPPKRRWRGFGRLVLWGLATLVVVLFAAWLVVESDWARETSRQRVEAEASRALGLEVSVASLDLDLFPPSVTLENVIVGDLDGADPPLATIDRLTIEVGPGLLRTLLGDAPLILREIAVTRPRIAVVIREDGSTNLPDLPQAEPSEEGGLEIRIGLLDLQEGELRVADRSVPLDFVAAKFRASARQTPRGAFAMEARSQRLRLDLTNGSLEGTLSFAARLEDDGLEIPSLELRGDQFTARGSGSYRDETLTADATINVDLATAREFGMQEELTGTLAIEATLNGEGDSWTVTSRATSDSLGLADLRIENLLVDSTVTGQGADWSGNTTVTSPTLQTADLRIQDLLLDGALTGNGADWSIDATATSPTVQAADLSIRQIDLGITGGAERLAIEVRRAVLAQGRLTGSVDLPLQEGAEIGLLMNLDGVDLARLLASLDAPVVGLEGAMRGQVDYRFVADAPLLGRGKAIVQLGPPRATQTTSATTDDAQRWSLPLSGSVPITIADGTLFVEAATLSAPGQRISLNGEVALDGLATEMRFGLSTEDPRAVLRILPAIYAEDDSPLWEPSRGHGTLNGTLSADLAGFRTDLELELLSAEVTGAPVSRIGGNLSIDSAGIQDLRLRLERDDSSVDVRAAIPFGDAIPGFTEPDFRVDLDLDSWNVGDAEPWLDLELPFDGLVTGELRIGGTPDAPSGHLKASVGDVSLSGVDLQAQLVGEIRFNPALVEFGPLRLSAPTGDVEIAGTLDPTEGAFDVQLESSPLSLAAPPFDDWVEGYLAGVAELTARLSGTLDSPELRARLVGSGLALESQTLGDGGRSRLDVSWIDGIVEVSGSLLGLVDARGGGLLGDTADLEIAFESNVLAEILALALGQVPEDLTGGFSGAIVVAGPTTAPHIEVRVADAHLTHLNHRLVNLEPIVVSFGELGARLESLYMTAEGTGSEIFVQGDLGSAEKEMDLRVVSTIDAAWLALYLPDLELRGHLELLAVVRGTPEAPEVDGQARLSEGRLILEGFPHAIDQIEGYAFFYPDRIVIDSGQAQFASGELKMTGDITLAPDGTWASELRFQGSDLDLRYPEDWRLRGDARLILSSAPSGSTLSGIVNVETAAFAREFEIGFTHLMRLMFQRRPELVEETDDFLVSTRLNIAVDGPDALRIQTNLADLRGDLDFSVRGTMALPVIFGQISLARGGQVGLGGTKYRVERGLLSFSNPFRNEPYIDLIASAQVKSYDVRLNVFGPSNDLQTSLSSTPPMSNLDIISLLTTGSADTLGALGTGSATDSTTEGSSAEAFLASQAASLAGQRVGNLLGFDQVQITPLTGGNADLSAARVTVGRRISRDVFVTYSHDPSESEEGIFELSWQIYPSIALILTRSNDGSVAVDLQWDKTF